MYNKHMNTLGKTRITYDGIKWTLNSSQNKYYRSTKLIDGKILTLHRYIYEKHHGLIPEGYEVHHVDFNHFNNNIENLVILTYSDHRKLHNKTPEFLSKRIEINKDKEFIKRCVKTKMKKGSMCTFSGRKHSEETKKKMSIARKKYYNNLFSTKNLSNLVDTSH